MRLRQMLLHSSLKSGSFQGIFSPSAHGLGALCLRTISISSNAIYPSRRSLFDFMMYATNVQGLVCPGSPTGAGPMHIAVRRQLQFAITERMTCLPLPRCDTMEAIRFQQRGAIPEGSSGTPCSREAI